MKITSVRLGRISVPLRTPFKTALRSVGSVEDVIVEIRTDCGAVGYGEAPPTGAITGDTTGGIIGAIQDHIAKTIIGRDGDKYLAMTDEARIAAFKDVALQEKLKDLKKDLADFHVTFDRWFSERTLYPAKVDAALQVLKDQGNLYEKGGAWWLATTKNGDDKDRVVIRANGEPTYFCSDIAYAKDKFERGFKTLVDIWGADHHGYIVRLKTAIQFLGYNPEAFKVDLLQMVTLLRDGKPVKMSKRTGEAVTLSELIEEVGISSRAAPWTARWNLISIWRRKNPVKIQCTISSTPMRASTAFSPRRRKRKLLLPARTRQTSPSSRKGARSTSLRRWKNTMNG